MEVKWNYKGAQSVQLQVGEWKSNWHHAAGKYGQCLNEWRKAKKKGDVTL